MQFCDLLLDFSAIFTMCWQIQTCLDEILCEAQQICYQNSWNAHFLNKTQVFKKNLAQISRVVERLFSMMSIQGHQSSSECHKIWQIFMNSLIVLLWSSPPPLLVTLSQKWQSLDVWFEFCEMANNVLYPLYSSDLVLCDFASFPKIKLNLKGWLWHNRCQMELQVVLDDLHKKGLPWCLWGMKEALGSLCIFPRGLFPRGWWPV